MDRPARLFISRVKKRAWPRPRRAARELLQVRGSAVNAPDPPGLHAGKGLGGASGPRLGAARGPDAVLPAPLGSVLPAAPTRCCRRPRLGAAGAPGLGAARGPCSVLHAAPARCFTRPTAPCSQGPPGSVRPASPASVLPAPRLRATNPRASVTHRPDGFAANLQPRAHPRRLQPAVQHPGRATSPLLTNAGGRLGEMGPAGGSSGRWRGISVALWGEVG
jgi:hypothetical protein